MRRVAGQDREKVRVQSPNQHSETWTRVDLELSIEPTEKVSNSPYNEMLRILGPS